MDMRRNVYMILFCLLTSVMGADCARAQEKASEKNMEVLGKAAQGLYVQGDFVRESREDLRGFRP